MQLKFTSSLFNLTKINPFYSMNEYDFHIILDEKNNFINYLSNDSRTQIQTWADQKYLYIFNQREF